MAEACRLTAYDLANMLAMEPAEITAAPEGLEYRELEPSVLEPKGLRNRWLRRCYVYCFVYVFVMYIVLFCFV